MCIYLLDGVSCGLSARGSLPALCTEQSTGCRLASFCILAKGRGYSNRVSVKQTLNCTVASKAKKL